MKKIVFSAALGIAAVLMNSTAYADALVLATPSFVVRILVNCGEGDVSCNNVTYVGTSRKTGKAITLKGRTLHTLCADGKTPCRFLGYEFKNKTVRYVVTEDGLLMVSEGKKVLVQEQGEWE